MRLSGTRVTAIAQGRGFGNQLWDLAGVPPSLDLPFSDSKSLVDATTGANLIDFTRASSGTYVDSQGVIRSATTNLLLQSEDFSTTWLTSASSVSTNEISSPSGSNTADRLIEGSSNAAHTLRQDIAVVSGASYTFSLYVKSAERSAIALRLSATSFGTLVTASYNLAAQTATIVTSGTDTSASITPVGNGWFRCSLTSQATSSTTTSKQIMLENPAGTRSYTGDGTSGIYIWGAQLEQSDTVGEYVKTTSTINSAPRFDHDPTTGESLGLLVEEQRTNLLTHSACNSNWQLSGGTTVSSNLGLNALGQFNGYSIASAGANWHTIYRTVSVTTGVVYAFAVFYRAGTSGRVRLTFRNNLAGTESYANGVIGSVSVASSFAGTMTVTSEKLLSDGLTYLLTGTITPNNTTTDYWFRIGPDSVTSGQTVIALGGQLEAGAFPTSYIPTTTTAVTRAADVASISGSNFSSWYRQDEGTVFSDLKLKTLGTSGFPRMFAFVQSDPNSSNQFAVNTRNLGSADDGKFFGTVGDGTVFGDFLPPAGSPAFSAKIALSAKQNDGAFTVAGYPVSADNTLNMPSPVELRIFGQARFQSNSSGWMKRLTYWPARLPNEVLQTITQ